MSLTILSLLLFFVFMTKNKQHIRIFLALAFLIVILFSIKPVNRYTSSVQFCSSCHNHPHAYNSWKTSVHYYKNDTLSVKCIQCHLPPKGKGFYKEKVRTGFRDVYSNLFKDNFNWEQKSQLEFAVNHTYKSACLHCHNNLFPDDISKHGEKAHFYYQQHQDSIHCIKCHLKVGHGESPKHSANAINKKLPQNTNHKSASQPQGFENFTETIPGCDITFEMIAINGNDTINSFYIGKAEVSWNEYLQFMKEKESEGRSNTSNDANTGATPPFGNPDQGWGFGTRPAITMTHHAAIVYCQWLTQKTGKTYRLPTSAEWNYVFLKSESNANIKISHISLSKTTTPENAHENKLGIKHLTGNVWEFCSDQCPMAPSEFIIKGGSFKTDFSTIKGIPTSCTKTDQWLMSDPQIPKSVWWYSDCNDVGFRVICEAK